MSMTTVDGHAFAREPRRPGLLRRALGRIVALRERQAEQAMASYLLALEDVSLDALGHDRARLARLAPTARPFL